MVSGGDAKAKHIFIDKGDNAWIIDLDRDFSNA